MARVDYPASVIDRLKLWEAEFRALLAPGESALMAIPCRVSFGTDRLERSPEEMERLFRFLPRRLQDEAMTSLQGGPITRTGWQKVWEKVLDSATGQMIDVDIDKLIGGVSATGHVGSWAHQLSSALGSRTAYCVVSNRRLLFAEQKVNGPFAELASLPRQAVVRAHRAGKIMQRGRVLLDFADLSQLALMTGILSTGPADKLVSTIMQGRV